MRPAERWALTGLAAVLVVTAGWWALALWPLPSAAPDWMLRARAVCFNTTPSGLPDASGWLLLVGQPLGMLGFLLVVWGPTVGRGLRSVAARAAGRAALAAVTMAIVVGSSGAVWRVADARAVSSGLHAGGVPVTYPRLDRDAPVATLTSQSGAALQLPLREPAFVTFAFAHCETVCPLVVHDVLDARRRLADRFPLAAVIITLDPWRDVPSRLPHIAEQWGLGEDEYVLSGAVADVEAALDAWGVARARDERTGDVVHPNITYIVDASGRIAYAANGGVEMLVELAERALIRRALQGAERGGPSLRLVGLDRDPEHLR